MLFVYFDYCFLFFFVFLALKRGDDMTLVFFVVFMVGSLQLIKEYRELLEFKRDEQSFNEYKNKEEEYLENKIQSDDFDW